MSRHTAFERWLSSIKEAEPCVLATVLKTQENERDFKLDRLFISKEGELLGGINEPSIQKEVARAAHKKLNEKNPKSETLTFTIHEDREINIFLDVYIPPSEILIFGAGHDAIPVAKYAVSLGWKTTIVDPRPFYNTEERFPHTNRIIADSTRFKDEVKINERTYIVVMNHHIERDQETLKYALQSESPYIGVLGPRKRRIRMMESIQNEGYAFSDEQLGKIRSPIGLDIGSETPEEIAISILAEIIAIKKGHTGGFLQDSKFIHKTAEAVQES